jgi:hypothetical protein
MKKPRSILENPKPFYSFLFPAQGIYNAASILPFGQQF